MQQKKQYLIVNESISEIIIVYLMLPTNLPKVMYGYYNAVRDFTKYRISKYDVDQ